MDQKPLNGNFAPTIETGDFYTEDGGTRWRSYKTLQLNFTFIQQSSQGILDLVLLVRHATPSFPHVREITLLRDFYNPSRNNPPAGTGINSVLFRIISLTAFESED